MCVCVCEKDWYAIKYNQANNFFYLSIHEEVFVHVFIEFK